MSVGSVSIGLQASFKNGRGVTKTDFLDLLSIQPGEVEATRASGKDWQSGMVYFAIVRLNDFAKAIEPTEAFHRQVVEAFRAAARFFDVRSPEAMGRLRAKGLSLRLFVEIRMDQDQMELELPSELLTACGRHGLGVYIISNDIPAAEALASGRAQP
jgi:hypothetical protein